MEGALWALGAAVLFALSQIYVARGVGYLGVLRGTAVMLAAGTAMAGVAALVIDGPGVLTAAEGGGITLFIVAGLFHFVGGWGFMNASARLVGAARMSAVTGTTPLFAAILAVLVLDEELNPVMGAGIVLIVVGTIEIFEELTWAERSDGAEPPATRSPRSRPCAGRQAPSSSRRVLGGLRLLCGG